MRRSLISLVLVALLIAPAYPHMPLYQKASAGLVPFRWDQTSFALTWSLNPTAGSNVTGSRPADQVFTESFATWVSAPNTILTISRAPNSTAQPGFQQTSTNNQNLVCLSCNHDFSNEPNTLAVTLTTTADAAGQPDGHGGTTRFAGQILDADIIFNPSQHFSTDNGTTGVDLQSVATHEIGHFFGLDHTPVVRAMMYPFSSDEIRTLCYDDVAGISTLYPKPIGEYTSGAIRGTVTLAGGGVIFGAHVFAESNTSATPLAGFGIRKSPVSAVTLPDGTYRITGLPADTYIVIAEPLDGPVTGDETSLPAAMGRSLQTTFTTRWH